MKRFTDETPATPGEKVAAVKALARANYEKSHGWQCWEECHTDEEIAERVKDCRTVPAALRTARRLAKLWTDAEQDARAV